jgi:hypothetical protein
MSASDKENDKDEKQWYEFPDIIAGPRLFRNRNELREKNLHDTEEPRSNARRNRLRAMLATGARAMAPTTT